MLRLRMTIVAHHGLVLSEVAGNLYLAELESYSENKLKCTIIRYIQQTAVIWR
jgi:hypothetical protein